jgi:hypothetical protein
MRYFVVGLAVLLLIVFGIVIFSHSTTNTVLPKPVKLSNYSTNTNSNVSYVVDGPITAPETHRSIKITVGPQSRNLEVFSGYQGQVIVNQAYNNDSNSYGQFLAALDRSGFTRVRRSNVAGGATAVCPLSNRDTYQVSNGATTVMNTWSSPCVTGTFAGNVSTVNTLFQAQIPDYAKLTQNVSVNGGGNVSIL